MKFNPFSAIFTIRGGRLTLLFAAWGIVTALTHGTGLGQESVRNSPHNLSASGQFGVTFAEEKRICVFCHVPHNTKEAEQLWSRRLPSSTTYEKLYDSTTLKALPKPDKPTGASRLCLSCHDGTIALEDYAGSPLTGESMMPSGSIPAKNPNLTSNLSDDHPISFAYTEALSAQQGELASPAVLPYQIKLEENGGLQCTACHDPHNNEFGNFLVIDNNAFGSPLCVACHKNAGWEGSGHRSLAPGCMNCHYAHNAPQPPRLLHAVKDEENCYLSCHNSGASPFQNVKPLFESTMHRHPVDLYTDQHDEKEEIPPTKPHVECVDCHNPHRSNSAGIPLANPPSINGPLDGVRKDTLGAIATKEYEICFKCHAGGQAANFSGITETRPNRVIAEPDQQRRFDGLNPSFHPVMAQRRGDGSSLIASFKDTMLRIYCSDCHNSDQGTKAGGSGANGPHGSIYEHILMAQYDMPLPAGSHPAYSANLYDLCFRCHDASFIMGSSSGFVNQGVNEHTKHVQERQIPCFACHDPHGIYYGSGSPANNAHLINFDKDYAPLVDASNPLYETSSSSGSGSCTVNCHTTGSPDPKKQFYSP